jgi:hypothetical protein
MRSFFHSAPVRLLGLLVLSVTLFLGGSYAARDDKPANDDKPARDDKAAQGDKPAEDKGGKPDEKDEKKEGKKDDKPPQPFTLRLEIMQLKPKEDKDDTSSGSTKETPRYMRYVALLKNENVMVRKRAALWLLGQKDNTARLAVYPALLETSVRDEDRELRRMVTRKLDGLGGEVAVYKTTEKADALLNALDDGSDATNEQRQVAYELLGGIYISENIDEPPSFWYPSRRQRLRAALERGLLDATPEGQAGAAESLELCDAFDEIRADAAKAPVKQRLILRPNREQLRNLGYADYTADDLVRLIRDHKLGTFEVRVVEAPVRPARKGEKVERTEQVVECLVTPMQRALLLSRVRLPEKIGRKLREFVRIEVAAPEAPAPENR